jgi:hypothetical protein
VGVVGTRARGTLNNGVHPWSTFNGVFSGWAGLVRGKGFTCAPLADWVVGASEGMVAILLAACALDEVVEKETAIQAVGGREGRQVRSLCDILCLGAGDTDDNRGGKFPFAMLIRGELSGIL